LEYKWKLLVLTTIGVFMTSLDGSILNIAIPALSEDLKATFEVVQWIPIIYLLIMAITLIGFGRLADLHGKKRFFLLGLIVFTIGSLLSATAVTGEFLIFYRAIQALGASLIAATSIAMVTEAFSKQETGKALGINVAGIYFGLVLGPVLGGFLVQALTWRSIFYINLPIGVVLILFSYLKVKEAEIGTKGERFDILGTTTFGLSLATFLVALTLGNQLGWVSIPIVALLIISGISFLAFIFVEKNVEFPMLSLALFRHNRIFAAANAAALINYIAIMGVGFLISIYLQSILGINPAIAGLLMLPSPMMMAITSPLIGRYSDKVGTRFLCAIGMTTMSIALLILINFLIYLPIEFILLSQLILGVGIGFFSSPNQSAIMKSVEKRQYGIASGTLSTMRVTGQAISIGLLSAILSIFILPSVLNLIMAGEYTGDPSLIQQPFLNGLVTALIVTIFICLLGALLSLVRGREETTRNQQSLN
jgi:EmrB/QacA subfamily drug resistance transporter